MQSVEITGTEKEFRASADLRIERVDVQRPDEAFNLIEEYYRAVDVIARDDRASLLRYLSSPESAIWVAYSGRDAAGCIFYRPLVHLDSAGEIKRLFVRPAYRGGGIARLLLLTLERFAAKRGDAWLYLDTKDDLIEAIAFYRRHNYKTCERYNDNPQATIFMRKGLLEELVQDGRGIKHAAPRADVFLSDRRRAAAPFALRPAVLIRTFQPGDEKAFRTLNEEWISQYFRLEDKDLQTLNDPQSHVLAPGGQIFMALRNGQTVGCCALLALPDGNWEIAKMAVAGSERGQGIGRQLLEYVIEYSAAHSISRLYIETNSLLSNAIHLYESVGFRQVPPERVKPSPYARADVFLERMIDPLESIS